jgi:RsiW-degrading membrane proteinase PrsW (M82 family)
MFEGYTQADWIRFAIVVALAALPAVIWSVVIFKGRKTSRWPLLLAFFLGTLTVLPLILLYNYLWVWFPALDVYHVIEQNVTDAHFAAIAALLVVGMLEELSKSGVVRIIGKSPIGIQTINDAVKYSILAGLGFAFTENVVYFLNALSSGGVTQLLSLLIFRGIFTVCAHMVFSGIYGYFYGLSKFARPIMETRLWMGERSGIIRIMSRILGTNEADTYTQVMLLKGILIAMILHAAFNVFLEFDLFFGAVLPVLAGFVYLLYLLAHKTGAIVFASTGQNATMAKRDVDTVLALLGMWTNEGRYKDVIDICQRLLLRDPDNKVVQLFQAKAMDKQKLANLETSVTSLFQAEDKIVTDDSLRTLVKQKVLMEMLKEKQAAVSAQTLQLAQDPNAPKAPRVPAPGAPQNGPSSPPNNP